LINEDLTPYERREGELERFENDKAEAARQGLTMEAFLTKKLTERIVEWKRRDQLHQEQREREASEAASTQAVVFSAGAVIVISALGLLLANRRKISTSASHWWRSKSKDFRVWSFGSSLWATGLLLFVILADPYGEGGVSFMDDDELVHMVSMMVIPPLFLGALWFGFKRFVR
jgi:p-aminobenzoyl-glutamate transporter AbgT